MQHLIEKVAYLKGMAEGMQLQNKTGEGRLLVEMLDVLDELIVELERSADRQDELHDYVDAIDEDLMDVESMVYEDDWADEAPAETGSGPNRSGQPGTKGDPEETYYM